MNSAVSAAGLIIAGTVWTNTMIDVIRIRGIDQSRCFLNPKYAARYMIAKITELTI